MAAPKTIDELYEVCSCIFKGVRVQVVRGDITKVVAHVIVNASNEKLQGGAGINGAIQRAAGPNLNVELASLYP
jgi:O-acetyl-ADP-ribose deacetylase (regulator of RNase III)